MGLLDFLTTIGPMACFVEGFVLLLSIISCPDGIDPAIVTVTKANPEKLIYHPFELQSKLKKGDVKPLAEISRVENRTADTLSNLSMMVDYILPEPIPVAANLKYQFCKSIGSGSTRRLHKKYGTDEPGPYLD